MTNEQKRTHLKRKFVFSTILKGLLIIAPLTWFMVWIINLESDYEEVVRNYIYHREWRIYVMLFLSEILFGIFPPELFIAALKQESMGFYMFQICVMATLSYGSGLFFFQLGRRLQRVKRYKSFIERRLRKEIRQVRRFGAFLIALSALTPVSFSITSFLTGLMHFPMKPFMYYASLRYVRFALYAVIAWRLI